MTGVQTCALPIWISIYRNPLPSAWTIAATGQWYDTMSLTPGPWLQALRVGGGTFNFGDTSDRMRIYVPSLGWGLTIGAGVLYETTVQVSNAATYVMNATTQFQAIVAIVLGHAGGTVVTLPLLSSPSAGSPTVVVKDEAGTASADNITIAVPSGGHQIGRAHV